jgi:methionyl aminopeptidase
MINIKTPKEIAIMREGGRILALIFKEISQAIRPGLSAFELDELAAYLIKKYKVLPAFKGYIPDGLKKIDKMGYPANLCVSINSEVVHGIPTTAKIISKGDIVGLDMGIKYQGFFLDQAMTVGVGEISPEARRLIGVTKKALELAIDKIKPGIHLGDVSATIQIYVEKSGFTVVRDLSGHGIGKKLHEDPIILNFGQPNTGPILKEGMVLAIEPMVNVGDYRVKTLSDGWTIVTADNSLSAHFEHTVAVTKNGGEILTKV